MARQVSHSHRTLRDFLANVSHELKTPLTSIQGFSQAMVDGAVSTPAEYAEVGRIVNDEAVRMRGLVDDLLYLSQAEAGEIVMHPDAISPNELLKSTRERFARRAEQTNVGLEVYPGALPVINADARRIEQALANIVDNAIRHTPDGGHVTLRSAADNGHVSFSVHNTGSFITDEQREHIFERFYQADPDVPAPTATPAWAWRSRATSSKRTAATWPSSARPTTARPSRLRCRPAPTAAATARGATKRGPARLTRRLRRSKRRKKRLPRSSTRGRSHQSGPSPSQAARAWPIEVTAA